MSPSAQVSDDEDKSDGQGTVYGDAETQKAENKSVMMMMKVTLKALRMGGDQYDYNHSDVLCCPKSMMMMMMKMRMKALRMGGGRHQ